MNKKYKVMDLFAGVGGLSYGFAHHDSFEILLANEFDKDTAIAYTLNHPYVKMIQGDIRDISEQQIRAMLGGEHIDLVVGGPPCQSYSTLGKRQFDDRARLFEEYCRILTIVQPRAFVFENVSGLMSMQGGELIVTIKNHFKSLGYDIKAQIMNAADYGVPQLRKRVIIVGTKGKNEFEYPRATHGDGLKPYVTVEDALSDLPTLKSGEENNEYATSPQNEYQRYLRASGCELMENSAPLNGSHLIRIMEALPDGGDKWDLPEAIRPKSGYGNTYAKMWWKRPAPTVTRNFATPSSSRCIHPRDSRAMTTREGARLQSFPDDYKFYGSRSKKNLEIGNAVPPLLSVAIADEIEKLLICRHDNEK